MELVNLVPALPRQCFVLHSSEQHSIEIQNAPHRGLHAIVSKSVEMFDFVDGGCVRDRWIHLC